MSQIRRLLITLPVLVLSIAALSVTASAESSSSDTAKPIGPPIADGGGVTEDSGGPNQSAGSDNTGTGSGSDGSSQSGDQNSDGSDGSTNNTQAENMFHQRGQLALQQAESQHKGGNKSQAQIEKVCESRQHGMQTRINSLATNAQNALTRINKIFTEARTYQQTKDLTVTDFDSLINTAITAQAAATTSVQALQSLKPTIDCSSTSAASQIATFQAAVKQARTDLLTYRGDVRAILVALEQAKSATSSTTTTTGGNQ